MSRWAKNYTWALLVTLLVTIPVQEGAAAAEKITYRLKWLINMSTVGDVVAEHQGFFKSQELDVTIKPGGPERDAIRELELGHADFGVASADQVIQAVAKGAPIVVIAQLFQTNPLQWIYFTGNLHLNTLADLKGRTIGVTFGKNDEFIMRTMLAQAGIADDQVKLFNVRLDYTPFYQHHVDLWPVYANTQALEIGGKLRAAGEAFAFLNPADYGVRFVANSVVTSARMAAKKPEIVRQFKSALLKGWQMAVDAHNADLAIAAVQQYDRDTSRDILAQQLNATKRLVQTQNGKPIGSIDADAWKQTEQIMLANHQIRRAVDVVRYLLIR